MLDASAILPRTALPHEVLRAVLEAIDRGHRVVVASVVARQGSAPSTPGQKLALVDDGAAIGTVGGGAVERAVLIEMVAAMADLDAKPKVSTYRLGPSLGMCCGGQVDVLVEPMEPAMHALVVGAGHVGAFTAPLLASLGFRVSLVDAREHVADPARAPRDGVRVLATEHDDPDVLRVFPSDLATAAMIVMTHDHQLDQGVIEWALAKRFGFVGGVGSRAKAARTRERLRAKGVSERDVERVRMPVGVDIGARSPGEIGVAIAAELVAWRAARAKERWASATANGSASAGVAPSVSLAAAASLAKEVE